MTTEIVQTNEYGEVTTEVVSVDTPPASESVLMHNASTNESTEESWRSIQAQVTAFFANATSSTTAFFKNNQQLLTTLGWIFLAFLGARLVLAGLDAIDDIPLVTPILKITGLVSVIRFVWRYLIREQNRQELMQTLDRAKTELFGSQS